ncbi:MAG: hypothetical protein WCJ55_05435 [Chloroflexales bacterium]
MSMDTFAAAILMCLTFLFALGIALSQLFDRYCRWADARDAVKASRAIHPASYVERRGDDAVPNSNFRTSRPEGEAEALRKVASGSNDGMIVLTQNALQSQLDDATRDGMVRAFAAIYRGGYIVPGKVSAVKHALFGVSGGRKLQALNAAIDAVVVPPSMPEPPQITPIAQRPVPNGLRFAGDARDEG